MKPRIDSRRLMVGLMDNIPMMDAIWELSYLEARGPD